MKLLKLGLWLVAGMAGLILPACGSGDEDAAAPDKTSELEIRWTPEAPAVEQTVSFSLGGDVVNVRSVLWMFGDGKTASGGASTPVEHAYAKAGEYVVKAAVTHLSGPMTELSKSLTVNDTEAGMVVSNDFPARMEEVSFSLNHMAGVERVDWDFGDGSDPQSTASASEILTHAFERDGNFTVRASITYGDGRSESLQHDVEVEGQSLSWACRNFDRSKMWIMAHRGNMQNGYNLPPNSMAAFRACVESGCVDFIETDVQITRDGEVICLHDNYLSRFTDYNNYYAGKGMVADYTLEELGQFRLKTTDGKVSDEQIPTLEEVLLEFRGKVWFNLDKCMESDVNIEKVYDVVRRCGCLDRVQFYISDNTDRADWLSQQEVPGILAPHANKESALTLMTAYENTWMVQTSTGYVTPSWIAAINARALSVTNLLDADGETFHNGNTTLMDSFVTAGVRMIQCDYPAQMDEYLRGKGKR